MPTSGRWGDRANGVGFRPGPRDTCRMWCKRHVSGDGHRRAAGLVLSDSGVAQHISYADSATRYPW